MYRIEYRKTTNRSLPLADIKGRRENGKIVVTRIVLNPVLRRKENSRIRSAIVRHEATEAKLIEEGMSQSKAHSKALGEEPAWFKKIRSPVKLRKAVGLL